MEPDFLHLEKLRKTFEGTDHAALSRMYSRPPGNSGSWNLPDDAGKRSDSFLSRYMTAVKKDIEDMLRNKTKEDL